MAQIVRAPAPMAMSKFMQRLQSGIAIKVGRLVDWRGGFFARRYSAEPVVDAEAQIFLRDNPIGPGDRVLAGLSVAFDASCEEMWLAWRYGACLVPAPRSLVRSGMDLGPWLVSRDITAGRPAQVWSASSYM